MDVIASQVLDLVVLGVFVHKRSQFLPGFFVFSLFGELVGCLERFFVGLGEFWGGVLGANLRRQERRSKDQNEGERERAQRVHRGLRSGG